jgi:endonuclease VIII
MAGIALSLPQDGSSMPEGDTIFRSAKRLDEWLTGRTVTKATTQLDPQRVPTHKLVGQTVTGVEARAKHLLIRFDSGMTLHTHMKMTGSWHVYRRGERWRKPAHQARLVLEVEPDRVAVCFNAPVVELLAAKGGEQLHPTLTNLGHDVLKPPVDLDEVRRRADALTSPDLTIGELLLDQRVVSGIGNIWRCESLFVRRLDPFARRGAITDEEIDALVLAASDLMQRSTGDRRRSGLVYGRARRPCHRCRTPIRSANLAGRTVYWCPRCQPSHAPQSAPGTA